MDAATLTNLYCYSTAAPGTGETYTYKCKVGTCGSAISYTGTAMPSHYRQGAESPKCLRELAFEH